MMPWKSVAGLLLKKKEEERGGGRKRRRGLLKTGSIIEDENWQGIDVKLVFVPRRILPS